MHEIAASFDSKATANPSNVQYFNDYKNVGTDNCCKFNVTIFLPICEAKQILLLHLFLSNSRKM